MPKNFPWRAGPIDPFAVFPLNPCGHDWGPFYSWRVTIFCCFVGWNIGIWHRFLFPSPTPLKKYLGSSVPPPLHFFLSFSKSQKNTIWRGGGILFSLKERVKERIDIFISYHSKEMKKNFRGKKNGDKKKIMEKKRRRDKICIKKEGVENIYNRMEKSEHIIETLHWLEVPNLLVENPHQKDIRK